MITAHRSPKGAPARDHRPARYAGVQQARLINPMGPESARFRDDHRRLLNPPRPTPHDHRTPLLKGTLSTMITNPDCTPHAPNPGDQPCGLATPITQMGLRNTRRRSKLADSPSHAKLGSRETHGFNTPRQGLLSCRIWHPLPRVTFRNACPVRDRCCLLFRKIRVRWVTSSVAGLGRREVEPVASASPIRS
jgi:hypothetical protein